MPLNESTTNLAEEVTTIAEDLVKQAYRESAGYDIRKGSAVYTIFIARLINYLQPVLDFIANILGALNINLTSTYTTFYDILAAVYLDERDAGGKATGDVVFGFSQAKLIEIDEDEIVYTNMGLQYKVTRKYVFSTTQLTNVNGIYYTPNVTVEAVTEGSDYEIGANEINGTLLNVSGLADVYNPSGFSGGSDKESNAELIQRLKDSVSSRTLSSLPGIRYLLSNNYSSYIKGMEIVKAGDPEMDRDKVYAQVSDGALPFDRVDFVRKVYNSTAEERSRAYYNFSFSLSPAINVDGDDKADIVGFNTELTQEEYNAIGGMDSNLVSFGAEEVLNEDWVRSEDTSDVTPWYVAETNSGKLRRYADFVLISGGRLKLGSEAVNENIMAVNYLVERSIKLISDFFKDTLSKKQNKELQRRLDSAVFIAGPKIPDIKPGVDKYVYIPLYSKFTDYLEGTIEEELMRDPSFKDSVSRANVSPVVQYPLPQNRGIIIKGDFIIEDDDKSKVRPIYITNFRANNSNPKAHDGYGIAVMPNIESGKPNLFITDNNALSDDIIIAGPQIFGTSLYENYLKGTNFTIDVGTKYYFELIYGVPQAGEDDAITLDVRIWESGESRPGPATLSYGAYVPMNVRSTNVKGEAQSLEATDFGFGILQTDGFNWTCGPVRVLQGTTVYAQILYMMDVSAFTGDSVELFVGHRGIGSDGGTQKDGSLVRIVDFDTPQSPVWEDVYSNTTGGVAFGRKTFDVDRYSDSDNYMFVLVSSQYVYDAVNDINALIVSDYVSVSKTFMGYNVGSKVDVYIHKEASTWDPETESYVDFMAVSGNIALMKAAGFNLPVTKIENVEILDGGGLPTGQYLVEYEDFRIVSNSPSEDGSVRENKILLLSNYAHVYNLRIRYKYITAFDTMQAYIDSDSARGSRADILLKHPQIRYITVSFTASYSGQDLINAIKQYVYEEINEIRDFDIIALAVQYGVKPGAVTSLLISSEYYDSDGNLNQESSSDKITKTRIQVFVAKTITIT